MSSLMQYVLRAFTLNIGQVVVTIVLVAIVLYFFVVLAFVDNGLRDQYTLGGHNGCDTLLSCYLFHAEYGIMNTMSWTNSATGWISDSFGGKNLFETLRLDV